MHIEWAVKNDETGELRPMFDESYADRMVETWKDSPFPYTKVSRTVSDWA